MIVRMFAQTFVFLVGMGVLMFGAAGTLAWPGAWCYLLELGALSVWLGLWLARHDPALLAERLGNIVQKQQSRWDRFFMSSVAIVWPVWLVLIAFDAQRWRWSAVPVWVNVIGALGIAVCVIATRSVFRANSYAAPVVKLQTERGHKVADTGPYAHVRHPMYAATIPFFVGTPLLLGSWWGLACAPLLVAALGYRAVLEERMLAEQLDGYAAYAARVRYRFVPGVW
ncbi:MULTISPECIES: isoprenylcysteine carboxylmethyltransferase family protein [Paraburkholderia]|uniref:methyltransferase family protein n=1 Tax=Paraburkholderia TaxID=1822464 RepID=UPI00225720B0|nr:MULTISPECIES: isoprenylcysteine carboxylmethyltransferase family protein [Paraburkholderia]MCX4164876.1 isoprenylcysteine carboxylmethyltransferase family protein [Paraburkholderia megapolitana]MDN7160369.1 isoprenylcysteine carboxylmethyltransferase family protein [Paraburkholderia sp. CHISQ3]MDQ6497416.1 isoprenylcysteine carboxylmethyltransferase family protein [Paraburkholderia megapolitana]